MRNDCCEALLQDLTMVNTSKPNSGMPLLPSAQAGTRQAFVLCSEEHDTKKCLENSLFHFQCNMHSRNPASRGNRLPSRSQRVTTRLKEWEQRSRVQCLSQVSSWRTCLKGTEFTEVPTEWAEQIYMVNPAVHLAIDREDLPGPTKQI